MAQCKMCRNRMNITETNMYKIIREITMHEIKRRPITENKILPRLKW